MTSVFRYSAAAALAWTAVAIAQAAQGYALAAYHGAAQQWWPSLGYALAIYSIWASLTWPIAAVVRAIEARVRNAPARIAAYLAMWPPATALHVGLFALVYWPFYNDGGRIATRWAMADAMFVRNFDADTLCYLALVGTAIVAARRRVQAPVPLAGLEALIVRSRGTVRRIPLEEIDWIGAAGDYAEVHCRDVSHLIEEPLRSLAARLPASDFARIHRGSVVRRDRVREVRSLGRGDARVRLVNGAELRLSRRFRANLALPA